MGTIEVSVVIPTYNRRDTLRGMLEALSRQTLAPEKFEVIVVVDGSTDGTWEMLQEIATPYALKPHYQENAGIASAVFSSGVSAARNRGAGIARGQILLFLDDDLLPLPELLEAHARFHRRDSTAVVLGRLLPSDETSKKRGWNRWDERVLQNHYKLMAKGDRPPAGWRLYSANFSVGRQQFLAVDGFDLGMGHVRGEDVELGFRLEDAGATYCFAPSAAGVHRGFRSFSSWCNSAYILGVRDIVLVKEKGRTQLFPRLSNWYRNKPLAVRWAVRLSLGRRRVLSALALALRAISGALSFLGFHRTAHMGYSTVFNLYYWHGVADELGNGNRVHPNLANALAGTEVSTE